MTTYYSRVQYTGDGTLDPKAVTFPFILAAYVEVYINGVLKVDGVDYTWPSSTTIAPLAAWPVGALVEFRRNTPKATSLVNFADGSQLNEAALDLNTTQLLHVAQESIDAVGDNAQVYATQAAASAGTAATEAANAAASAAAAASSELAAASDAAAAAASAASINPASLVHNTGAESIAGVKTFSSSPVVPDATGSTEVASKGQMDTADAAVLAAAVSHADSLIPAKAGNAKKYLRVTAAEDGLEYAEPLASYSAGTGMTLGSVPPGATNATALTKVGEFQVPFDGVIRAYLGLDTTNNGYPAYGQIYKNGVAFGTLRSTTATGLTYFVEDLSFTAGDVLQFYARATQNTVPIDFALTLYSATFAHTLPLYRTL